MGALQPWHWIVLLVVVLLLFGSSRLPGLAKSVGQSMKIFKKEIKDLRDDGSEDANRRGEDAPGGSTASTTGTTSTTGSTAGPAAGSGSDSIPGLIANKDRDIPKA